VSFGTEILFMLALGLLILSPKRLQEMLGHVARAKARFEEASRAGESEMGTELEAAHTEVDTDGSRDLIENQ
jgi:Sec-independent protein translocase protein TatA